MGQVISEALMNLLSVQNLIFVNVGIFIGIIFGAIPGMNGNLAITVLLPFTIPFIFSYSGNVLSSQTKA
mgnify:CR=1 FL=1